MPRTQTGHLSLWLLLASALFFVLFFVGIGSGQRGGDTFFSNPYLAGTILAAAIFATSAGGAGAFAAIFHRERSPLTVVAILFGSLVLAFGAAEIIAPH